MKSTPEQALAVEPVPSPALANTSRDADPTRKSATVTTVPGERFERVLQSAWRRAAARGFVPGREREDLLESEFERAIGRDRDATD